MEFKDGGQKFMDFYDKTLMKLWKNNFAKKYDTDITMVEYAQNDETIKLPTLKLTEKMREDILKGQKMFAEGGYVDDGNAKVCKAVHALKKNIARGKN